MKKSCIALASVVPVLMVSCLRNDFREPEPSFGMDRQEISLPSGSEITDETLETGRYPKTLEDVVCIDSNHGWRAEIVPYSEADDLSWLSLSENVHLNPSQSTQNTRLAVTAQRSRQTSDRSAMLVVTLPDGKSKALDIHQAAAVLELREPVVYNYKGTLKDIAGIRAVPADTCFIKIVTNSVWTAKLVKKETTADASVLHPSGSDDAVIQLVFRPNQDDTEKTAKLEIAAEGCETRTIVFNQQKGGSL